MYTETFKWIFVCLAASFLAVSCTETTDFGNDYGNTEIRFTTDSDSVATRGLPILSSTNIPNMGVLAYYTGNGSANNWAAQGATATPNFLDNVLITNNSGSWSYADPVYWPQAPDANVTFFAYSPHATAANGITLNGGTGIPSITYTVPANCSDQPDLMVSALLPDLNKTTNASSPVNFQMKHALTSIGFKASGNGEKIEKITVKGVKTSGTLTVAANGSPSWNLSGVTSGDFEATVDDGVYLGAMAQLVNTGGGYLMMIPQTLGTGATLTVNLTSGRSFDFDLNGLTWEAGKFINYTLSITPEAALLLTPDKIVLPPMGGFSQFNVIVENGSNLSWSIKMDNPGFEICDNLAHMLAWAEGTLPAANVHNADGSDPTTTYLGAGSKTLYVWKPTANTSTTNEITGVISDVANPDISINVVQLPAYPMEVVRDDYIFGQSVGAFWKASQIGERIIRIPVGARSGKWDASVFWLGSDWYPGDIVFSKDKSDDPGVTFNSTTEHPVDMLVAANDATYKVSGYVSSASGNAVAGAGNYIDFRIGLTSTHHATPENPARYALVLLRYGGSETTPYRYHVIYIRQGEDADYLMAPGDRPAGAATVRFAAYNTTASNLTDDDLNVAILVGRSNAVFTDYPSQAGAFFQWSNEVRPLAYNPIKPVRPAPATWTYAPTGNYWNSFGGLQESCPPGYRRPNDGTTSTGTPNSTSGLIANSEIRQSLYFTPPTGITVSDIKNYRYGFYADGFFDRRDHDNPAIDGGNTIEANTAVSWTTKDVAYVGSLLFNPTSGSSHENASLFIPSAGYRHSDDTDSGLFRDGGTVTLMLSSSTPNDEDMWYYKAVPSIREVQQLYASRDFAMSLRCVKE